MRFAINQRLTGDDGKAYDNPIGDAVLIARHPTDEEVLDAIDTALCALVCRGASYHQIAKAIGTRHKMTVYRRCERIQPHILARVKGHYGID